MSSVSTFIMDPNRLSREGLKRLMAGSAFDPIGAGADLEDLRTFIGGNPPPRLVLIDLPGDCERPGDFVRAFRSLLPESHLVVLTTRLDFATLAHAFAAGVDGYLLKDISCEALLKSLSLVALGEKVYPTSLADLFAGGLPATERCHTERSATRHLSGRERQVLNRLAVGESNKGIANSLAIAEATVKVHLKSILRKIDAANRTQAAIWAVNNGLAAAA